MPEEEEKKKEEEEALEEWKVRFKDGTVFAPVTYDQLVDWYKSGQIGEKTPVAENILTAEWVEFRETEGFAVAKAAKEGREVFCTSCGTPWPMGTKFCTKCGTFIETGEKIVAAGQKKPERTIKLRPKAEAAAPEQAEVAAEPEQAVETPVVEQAPQAAEAVAAGEMAAGAEAVEAAGVEAAEAAAPPVPRKRRKSTLFALPIALVVAVVGLAVLAPEKISNIVEKVKGLVGLEGKTPGEKKEAAEWAGVRSNVRSAIQDLQQRISSALRKMPFSQGRITAFEAEIAGFLKGAVEEFTDADAFVSLAATLAEGKLREAARFLEEERSLLGAGTATPRIDAIQGAVEIILGREKKGMPRLGGAVGEEEIARAAASFCRGAVEGCLEKLVPAQGRQDLSGTAAEILGVDRDYLRDDFFARHCGKAISGLTAVQALTGGSPAGPAKEIRTKVFARLLGRGNQSVQTGLVELGKSDPAKRPSVLKYHPARVAYVSRLMSDEGEQTGSEREDELVQVLKEGLSADPDNAFYNYALAAMYLRMNKDEQATAEIATGNEKPAFREYGKERMEGLAKVLDTTLPYTAATMIISSPNLSALANSSRGLLGSASSFFRVGRRKEVFEMLAQCRIAWERIKEEACTFKDALAALNAALPLMAAEAEFYRRDGKEAEAWEVRKALAENRRLAMAIEQCAGYGLPAVAFVKEVLSEEGYQEEFSNSSPQELFSGLLSKATEGFDRILSEGPAKTRIAGINMQDQYYVAANKSLEEKKYERAFEYARACLVQNPKHVWALKVMQEAVSNASGAAEVSRPKAVAYRVVATRDMSLPEARRMEYHIQVSGETTRDEAIATVRTALQGFLRREKPDALRIYVVLAGSRLPYVRLDWAPGGEWEKAKQGTPYTEFEESLKVFERAIR